jgi:tetratricopeptide (TPR) repeat protein
MDRRGKSSKPKSLAPTLALAFVVLLATWMGVADGGYFVADWSPAVLALAALALVASVAGALSPAASRWAAVALGLFAAYAGWTFISLLWSPNRGNAWFGAGLTLLYLLAFWLALGLIPLGASRRWALAASAIGPAVIAAHTLATLVPRADELFEDGRLSGTVGYTNGEAAFLLAPFWAAVYLGGSPRVHPVVRGAVLAGAVLCASLAVLTQSRGAMVAMAASLPIYFLVSGQRLRGLFAFTPIALALVVAYPSLNDVYLATPDQEAARTAIGRALPIVWLGAAGAGLCGLVWGLADRRWSPPSSVTRAVGGVALAGALAVFVLGAAAFAERVGNPVDWGEQQWEAFKADDEAGQEQSRFLSASGSGRYTYWRVAWEDFASRPLLGVGTHNYEATYYQKRERAAGAVRQPHSLPLEVLAERGLVGGILFFGFLAACVGAGLRERFVRLDSEGKAQVGALVAALAYWFVHSGIDWFWQLPAVTLPAAVYLAMLVGPWQRTEAAPPRWPLRAVGAGLAVLAMLAVAPLYVAARYSQHSYAVQDPKEALAAVERAQRFIPVDPSIRQQVARNAELVGDWGRAEDAYRDAIRLNPDHFLPYTQLARFYELRGRPAEALPYYQQALALNPLDAAYEIGLNRRAIDLLARAPVDATPVRFMSGGDELGRLTLTVANGSQEREQALRGAEPPPNGAGGVLLVWPDDAADPLRAEGTTDPADVAFADADGNVTEVASLGGPDEEARPRRPYRLAMEAKRGFFEEHGIGPGDRAVFAASP